MRNYGWGTIGLGLVAMALSSATVEARPHPWIEIAGGHAEKVVWSVEARRPGGTAGAGPLGTWRPCLRVVTLWRTGPFSYDRTKYRTCTGATRRLSATEPPLIATGIRPANSTRTQLSSVGMLFAPAVSRLRVTLAGDHSKTFALRSLSSRQARASGLRRLRYAAFIARGTWCADRLVSLSASGRVLWDSGANGYDCPGAAAKPLLGGGW
jgi:hypothetical protein